MTDELMAGTRDASWYERPNVYEPKKIHVASRRATSACGGVPLTGLRPAGQVPAIQRCQSSGCKTKWPKEGS